MSQPSQVEVQNMNQLLKNCTAALLALNLESLMSELVSRGRSYELTLILLANIAKLFAAMSSVFTEEYIQKLKTLAEELPDLVMVYYAADLKNENPWSEEQKKRKKELVSKVRGYDKFMFDCLWLLFKDHPELGPTLKDIKKHRGHRDGADDIIRMSEVGKENWDDIVGKSPLTLEYINQAESDANEFVKLLDIADQKSPDSPRQMKRRAYTMWHTAYKELCLAGRFLLRHQEDAKEQFPGVHSKSK